MDRLHENRYVKSVSASTIQFTEEFKRYFYQESTSETPSRQIFLACGIDPDILGASRIEGFRYTLHKQAKREEGFTDKRQNNYRRESKPEEGTVETRLRQLEHELAYTRQEAANKKSSSIWGLTFYLQAPTEIANLLPEKYKTKNIEEQWGYIFKTLSGVRTHAFYMKINNLDGGKRKSRTLKGLSAIIKKGDNLQLSKIAKA